MTDCPFIVAWLGKCANPGGPFCHIHAGMKCKSCGQQATHECSVTFALVCGTPLCDDCEGYEKGPPAGFTGSANHSHHRKSAA